MGLVTAATWVGLMVSSVRSLLTLKAAFAIAQLAECPRVREKLSVLSQAPAAGHVMWVCGFLAKLPGHTQAPNIIKNMNDIYAGLVRLMVSFYACLSFYFKEEI